MTAHFAKHRFSEVALRHLLGRVAVELSVLHQSSCRVEDMLGTVLAQGGGGETPAAASLQGLDHFTQTLDALAQFLTELARGLDPSLTVDITAAIGKVPLRDLALALVGQMVVEQASPPHHSTCSPGIVDFF